MIQTGGCPILQKTIVGGDIYLVKMSVLPTTTMDLEKDFDGLEEEGFFSAIGRLVLLNLGMCSDNITMFAALFMQMDLITLIKTIILYIMLEIILISLAYKVASWPTVRETISRYGPRFVPLLWIVIGVYILSQSVLFPHSDDTTNTTEEYDSRAALWYAAILGFFNTNVDAFSMVTLLFAETQGNTTRNLRIACGQFIGFFIVLTISVLITLPAMAFSFPLGYLELIGFVPLIVGLLGVVRFATEDESHESRGYQRI